MSAAQGEAASPDLGFYFDVHGHREGLMPKALRLLSRDTIPPDFRLKDCRSAGVTGFVVCALGDPNTFLPVKVDALGQVLGDLAKTKKAAEAAGARIALGPEDLEASSADRGQAFVLGVEGGDFVGDDVDRLDQVHAAGARLLGLVHYSANSLGSIAYGWGGRVVPEAEQTGLTELGRKAIQRANRLGMIVDLAHADEKTAFAALEASSLSPICSHTGPRALQPSFPRYISDELMRAIGQAGGLVGLWAFLSKGSGVPDLATFGRYAAHCAELAGAEHLAIGTDVNGVPGNMVGYMNPFDAPKLLGALAEAGFSKEEVAGIAGGNFLRYWKGLR